MRKTKIVCTLGPATDREGVLRQMLEAGMNVARFNFSHGSHAEHKGRLDALKALRAELGLPVAVENDVNAAAAGEFAFGAARDEQDFLMVSYGTGVGGAVYIGGRLYRGRAGSAGEFGGLVTHPEAVDPARQGTGSYERYASTSALVARVTALYPALTTGRDIFAHLNDPTIKKEVDAWIREVACGIISLIHAFDPALVVLGGGIITRVEK